MKPNAARTATVLAVAMGVVLGNGGAGVMGNQLLATASAAPADVLPVVLSDSALVTYDYSGSSVAPPFHRSYTLTFDRASARLAVRDYTNVLADRTEPMPAAVWNQVAGTFDQVSNLTMPTVGLGCLGGWSFTLAVDDEGIKGFPKRLTPCNAAQLALAEKVTEWIAPVRSLFPPIEQLAPTPA